MERTDPQHSICFTLAGFRTLIMHKPTEHGVYVEVHALRPRPTGLALDTVKKKISEQVRQLGWPEKLIEPSFVRYDKQQFTLTLSAV